MNPYLPALLYAYASIKYFNTIPLNPKKGPRYVLIVNRGPTDQTTASNTMPASTRLRRRPETPKAAKVQKIMGTSGIADPLEVLGCNLLERVFQCLDNRDLQRAAFVTRKWEAVALSAYLWKPRCSVSSRLLEALPC